MANSCKKLALLSLLAAGCASAPTERRVVAAADGVAAAVDRGQQVSPVAYQDLSTPTLAQPATVAESVPKPETDVQPLAHAETEELPRTSNSVGLTPELVEELALANSPAISQAAARIRALRGKWVQVGLPPNPTVGYLASEIGADGSAGQQGGFAGQEFITAQKLRRNRSVVCAEIARAEQQLAAIVQRVQTDARLSYYNALLAQRRIELAKDLVHQATEAAQASKSLLEVQEIPLAGLLQTEVRLQNAKLRWRTSGNGLDQAWRQLQTLVGSERLPRQALEGDVSRLPMALDFQDQLVRLQSASPEVAVAMVEVERHRRALNRACVESIPNVNAQVSLQYDNTTNETLTGVQVGIPLPIWNRNQGGIRQARANLTAAARNVDRVELNLQQRMTDAFRQYADAQTTVETYTNEILTRSRQSLKLVQQGYSQGEVGYLDLLAAQSTFSQTNLAYLDALGDLWQSYLRIDGMMLEGSLKARVQ